MALRRVGLAAAVIAQSFMLGCGSGSDGGDAGPGGSGNASGEVGAGCGDADDCTQVAYPECVDLAETGDKLCESVCEGDSDCSDNAQCVRLGPDTSSQVCLVPCSRDANCQEGWSCAFDPSGVGFCLWPELLDSTGPGGVTAGSTDPGEVSAECEDASDCGEVAFPECVDLAETGTTLCESVCDDNTDCSDNTQCIALQPESGGICLLPCDATADCQDGWSCVLDTNGIGFCLWPDLVGGGTGAGTGGLDTNEACAQDAECGGRFPVCGDLGDGVDRCVGQCLGHPDCPTNAACVEVDVDIALCLEECTEAADCPADWTCDASDSGPSFCLPPPAP